MKNKGFTLIEMIVVMTIIGILAALISAATFRAIEDAKESKAAAAISAVEAALAMYESDVAGYPLQAAGDNAFKSHLQNDDGAVGWNGPYMNFIDEDLDKPAAIGGTKYMDPWGNAYQYKCPGNNGVYDIWSCGNDGVDDSGGGDDINAWD
ncbi:MAG: type II secretion system major pseudopilin GspG [Candidatus Omnitrophica bacterium]|nr:type II secretion system major pseudopilin GspG [Candidatus Omnitrophota bacterium]